MSKTLLHAMKKSRTASRFLKKEIFSRLKKGKPVPLPGRKAIQTVFPKGKHKMIYFVDETNSARVCSFSIGAMELRKGNPKTKKPRVVLFKGLPAAGIEWGDFGSALKETGTDKFVHYSPKGPAGSVSIDLLIPEEAVAHWQKQEIEFKGKRITAHPIKHKLFGKLSHYAEVYENLNKFIEAVKVQGSKASPYVFARRFHIISRASGMHPLDTFLAGVPEFHALFSKLANSTDVNQAAKIISKEANVSRKFSRKWAEIILGLFSQGNARQSAIALMNRPIK